MSKWEKINIFDAESKGYRSFFDERYGLITNISIGISLVDKDSVVISNVYGKDGSHTLVRISK